MMVCIGVMEWFILSLVPFLSSFLFPFPHLDEIILSIDTFNHLNPFILLANSLLFLIVCHEMKHEMRWRNAPLPCTFPFPSRDNSFECKVSPPSSRIRNNPNYCNPFPSHVLDTHRLVPLPLPIPIRLNWFGTRKVFVIQLINPIREEVMWGSRRVINPIKHS